MHEYSIASNIIESLTVLQKQYPDKPILQATITAGKLQQIVPEPLFFCLDLLKKDTIFADVKFVFKENDARIKCRSCNKVSVLEDFIYICPECGSTDIEVLSGSELLIESIDVDD